jgi:hypothetical protein
MSARAAIADWVIRWALRQGTSKALPVGPDPEDPTYWRWFLIPRNRFFNMYAHCFLHDDAEDLHDHQYINITFPLRGSYWDERYVCRPREGLPLPLLTQRFVPEHSFLWRLPSTPQRVVLQRDEWGQPVPTWSLFICLPRVRSWGFWCPGDGKARWVHWKKFIASRDGRIAHYGQRGGVGCEAE